MSSEDTTGTKPENKKENVDDSPDQQFVDSIVDLENITVTDLKLGVLNELPSHTPHELSLWDPFDQVASTIRLLKGQLDGGRKTHKTKVIGMVVKNPTPVNDNDPIVGELRETSKDSEYRLGLDRAYCYVYVPQYHRHMLRPETLDPDEMSTAETTSLDFYTKVWGDRPKIKDLAVGSFVNIELQEYDDLLYATLEEPDGKPAPKRRFIDPKKEGKKPGPAARNPKSKKTKGPKKKIKNVLNNKTAEKALALPPPKPRPSPETTEQYHTSVDKELLKGPYPGGYSDWTGAGGGGTLASQATGTPKRGRKRYYLKGDERGTDGELLLTNLPTDYALYGRSFKIHRAALGPLIAMIEQARQDGIPAPFITVYSAWRSFEAQLAGFKHYFYSKYGGSKDYPMHHPKNRAAYRRCRKYNGDPTDPKYKGKYGGDHMAGRGVDLFLGVNQNAWSSAYQKKHGVGRSAANGAFKSFMKDKPIFLWLKQNAQFFGFYNYAAEPWHWCFNPDDRPKRSDRIPEFFHNDPSLGVDSRTSEEVARDEAARDEALAGSSDPNEVNQ